MEIRKSERKRVKTRLGIQGPSGSGKTYSSLLLAGGLTNGDYSKVVIIDTEGGSSDLYSHLGNYNVLQLVKPFNPERYIEAISLCESAGMEVIIIDSLSHEWQGDGGIIDVHGNLPGNSFTNWAKLTPRHNALVQSMLQSSCHIIGTLRTKMDYVLQDKGGKLVPEKIGLAAVQRDDLSYEFTVLLDLDIRHNATASKDRTNLFSDKPPFIITKDTGKKILDFCNLGRSLEKAVKEIKDAKDVAGLRDVLKKYPEFSKELEPLAVREKNAIEHLEAINAVNDLNLK
jgi:hypothetical protein